MSPDYIDSIAYVRRRGVSTLITLDSECKRIYASLKTFSDMYGYDYVYPNQEDLSVELGINERSVRRKLKVLENCGFIRVHKKRLGRITSNRYSVYPPHIIKGSVWLDINKEVLRGEGFTFKKVY